VYKIHEIPPYKSNIIDWIKRISWLPTLAQAARFDVGENAFQHFAKVRRAQRLETMTLTVQSGKEKQTNLWD
jgi:16S rRNA U1498 N3-methylase RsmE